MEYNMNRKKTYRWLLYVLPIIIVYALYWFNFPFERKVKECSNKYAGVPTRYNLITGCWYSDKNKMIWLKNGFVSPQKSQNNTAIRPVPENKIQKHVYTVIAPSGRKLDFEGNTPPDDETIQKAMYAFGETDFSIDSYERPVWVPTLVSSSQPVTIPYSNEPYTTPVSSKTTSNIHTDYKPTLIDNKKVAPVVQTVKSKEPDYTMPVRERFGVENRGRANIVLQVNRTASNVGTWVQIENVYGKVVFSKILAPGDVYYVPTGGLYRGTFGNVACVDFWVNGKLAPTVIANKNTKIALMPGNLSKRRK